MRATDHVSENWPFLERALSRALILTWYVVPKILKSQPGKEPIQRFSL